MSQQLRHNRLWRRDMQVIESHLNAICPFQSNAMDHNVANPHPTFQYHIHGTIPMELFNVKKVGFSNIYCIIREIND